jgi:hypothetical protein
MSSSISSKSLASLVPADFESRVGETFTLAAAGHDRPLKLVEVQHLGHAVRAGGAFSLQFHAPAGPAVPQAVYSLHHPVLGTLDLFIVPLGPKDGVNRYEAVFT